MPRSLLTRVLMFGSKAFPFHSRVFIRSVGANAEPATGLRDSQRTALLLSHIGRNALYIAEYGVPSCLPYCTYVSSQSLLHEL